MIDCYGSGRSLMSFYNLCSVYVMTVCLVLLLRFLYICIRTHLEKQESAVKCPSYNCLRVSMALFLRRFGVRGQTGGQAAPEATVQ